MAQHDLDIANGSGAAVRADITGALQALGSVMKGPNAPSAPQAGMLWWEDDSPSSTRWTLRAYDGADWIKIGILDSTANVFEVASTTFGLTMLYVADAAAARSIMSAMPSPIVGAGAGSVVALESTVGGALAVPSGGTWYFTTWLISGAGSVIAGTFTTSVAAGGSTVGVASTGNQWVGFGWRVT